MRQVELLALLTPFVLAKALLHVLQYDTGLENMAWHCWLWLFLLGSHVRCLWPRGPVW